MTYLQRAPAGTTHGYVSVFSYLQVTRLGISDMSSFEI